MKTQLINFTIPQGLLTEVDQLAKKQSRSRSELLREAARKFLEESTQKEKSFSLVKASGKKVNLTESEAIKLIDAARIALPINR